MHTMHYIDVATTGIPSHHVLPVEDLWKMLLHIKAALPLTMHLPISSEDMLHFYRYLCTHILIADKQFLLLINIPIQDHAQQLEMYEVFNLAIPHRNFLAWYNINSKYLGITYDKTKAMQISEQQLSICQRLMDNLAILMHLFNHLPTHHHVLQPYTQRTKQEFRKDAHCKSGMPIV